MADTPYPLARSARQSEILQGTGAAEYGPFSFQIFDVEDVTVFVRPHGGGPWTETAVTVAKAAGLADFTVTFAAPLTSASDFIAVGLRLHERSLAVTRGGALSGEWLEKELSKQGAVLQEQHRDIDRAVKAQYGSDGPMLPAPEAARVLAWDEDGNLINAANDAAAVLVDVLAAQAARDDAEAARDDAVAAKDETVTARDDAVTAKNDAETARDEAEAVADGLVADVAGQVAAAEAAKTGAESARDAALLSTGLFASTAQGIGRGVRGLTITAAGSGGTNGTATIAFTGGTAVIAATGLATISGGAVVAVEITQPGLYTADPTGVTITGAGALAGATVAMTLGANTAVNSYFSVPVSSSDNAANLYRVDAGPVATLITTYASASISAAVKAARMMLGLSIAATAYIPAAGSVTPQVYRGHLCVVGKRYSMVLRFQRAGLRYVHVINTAAAGTAGVNALFDCVSGSLVTTVGTATATDLGGGWTELVASTATVTTAATTNTVIRVSPLGAYPYTANGTDNKVFASAKYVEFGTTTNLFPSDDLADASWTKSSCTAVAVTSTETELLGTVVGAHSVAVAALQEAVSGVATAARLVEASGTTNSRAYKAFTVTSGLSYKYVIEAKADSRKWLGVIISSGALMNFKVNLATGEYIRDPNVLYAAAEIAITYAGNGFWRIEITVAATASGSCNFHIIVLGDDLVWPNRTGDGVSGFAVNSAELYQSGVLQWRATDFTSADWIKDGVTVTENAVVYGGLADAMKRQPDMVDFGGAALTSLPNGGAGIYGPGKVTLGGRPFFTPGSPKLPDLQHALRAALAYEIANTAPVMFLGDSITWATHEVDRRANMVDMFTSFINQGSPGDEPVLTAVADYLLPTHGVTVSGTVSNGTTGPLGESLVMQAGAVLTFTGAYELIDVFYNQASGAGSLAFAFNGGAPYKTVNCAGAAELDKYSGPSPTGQTVSGTFTITCSGGPVEITGLDRLGVKAAGSLARVRVFRWAHGSYNFAHFTDACIASAVKQASAFSAVKPLIIAPLGINERQAVGAAGLATMKTRFEALLGRLAAAGLTRIIWQMPLRTSAAADAGFYAAALSYDNLIGGMQEVLWGADLPSIGTHALNLPLAGKMDGDGIHPTERGLYDTTQMAIEGICRIRGVV